MTDDDNDEQTKSKTDESEDKGESSGGDGQTAWEEYASDSECPECGEPIIDVRSNCPNCGYEYKEEDFGDKEAGKEFLAGTAVTDEGEEIPDHESGTGEDADGDDDAKGAEADDDDDEEEASEDTSDDSSDDTSDDTSGDE